MRYGLPFFVADPHVGFVRFIDTLAATRASSLLSPGAPPDFIERAVAVTANSKCCGPKQKSQMDVGSGSLAETARFAMKD